jgi:hypothetical protein
VPRAKHLPTCPLKGSTPFKKKGSSDRGQSDEKADSFQSQDLHLFPTQTLFDVLKKVSSRDQHTAELQFHQTPEHCSWLNMAEVETADLTGQCLEHRIGSQVMATNEIGA